MRASSRRRPTGRINLFAGRGDVDHEVTTRYADA